MTSNRKQRITLFLDPSLAKHAKVQALVENLSLTALVEMALIKYLPKETVIKKLNPPSRKASEGKGEVR